MRSFEIVRIQQEAVGSLGIKREKIISRQGWET